MEDTKSELFGKSDTSPDNQRLYNDEQKIENLAKEALAETIRDGGAFARENSNRFKL